MGQIFGGILGIFMLSAIWEWAVYKRVLDDPLVGKVLSVVTAYITAVILFGFGDANGGPWTPDGILIYLPGAIIVGIYFIRRGLKLREESRASDADVFQ